MNSVIKKNYILINNVYLNIDNIVELIPFKQYTLDMSALVDAVRIFTNNGREHIFVGTIEEIFRMISDARMGW